MKNMDLNILEQVIIHGEIVLASMLQLYDIVLKKAQLAVEMKLLLFWGFVIFKSLSCFPILKFLPAFLPHQKPSDSGKNIPPESFQSLA
jgi:hypothetical protein